MTRSHLKLMFIGNGCTVVSKNGRFPQWPPWGSELGGHIGLYKYVHISLKQKSGK